jgi:uncharacterized membrane protein
MFTKKIINKNLLVDLAVLGTLVVTFVSFFIIINYKISGFLLISGDTAVAEQALWNTVHGDWFYQSFLSSNNFREHLNFSQFLFLPFYYFFPKLQTIFVVIGLTYAIAAFLLFRFAKERLGNMLAIVVSLSFLLNPIAVIQNIHTMHVVAIGAPFLILTLIFYEKRNYARWIVFLLLTVSVSEFVAPTIFLLGVIAWREKRSLKWIVPSMISSGLMYLASTVYITMGFSETKSLLATLRPQRLYDNSWGKRIHYLSEIFRPAMYIIPFFSKYFLLLLPTIALDLVILNYNRLASGSHLFSLVPAIFAMIFIDVLQKSKDKHKKIIAGLIFAGIIISIPIWYKEVQFKTDERSPQMKEAILWVKDSGSVTSPRMMGYFLNHRHDFYLYDNGIQTDYVIINSRAEDARSHALKPYLAAIAQSPDYLKVMDKKDVSVYVKKKKAAELIGKNIDFINSNPEEATRKFGLK